MNVIAKVGWVGVQLESDLSLNSAFNLWSLKIRP